MWQVEWIEDFCKRLAPALEQLDFTQRRQLVELLIDRVIVDNDKVEIRYVIPTGPQGEQTLFCHLRKDYFDLEPQTVIVNQFVVSEFKVAAEKTDMCGGPGASVGFDDDDDIQGLAKLLVAHLHLIDVGLDVVFQRRLLRYCAGSDR